MSILNRFRRALTRALTNKDENTTTKDNEAVSTISPLRSKEEQSVSDTPSEKDTLRCAIRGEIRLSDLTLPERLRHSSQLKQDTILSYKNEAIDNMSDNHAASDQTTVPQKGDLLDSGSGKTVVQPQNPTMMMPEKKTLRLDEQDKQQIYNSISSSPTSQSNNGESIDKKRTASPRNQVRSIDSTWVDDRSSCQSGEPNKGIASTLVYEPPDPPPSETRHRSSQTPRDMVVADDIVVSEAPSPDGPKAASPNIESKHTVNEPSVDVPVQSHASSFVAPKEKKQEEMVVQPARSDDAGEPEDVKQRTFIPEESSATDHLEEILSLFSRYNRDPLSPAYRWAEGRGEKKRLSSHIEMMSRKRQETQNVLLAALAHSDPDQMAGTAYAYLAIFKEMAVPQIKARLGVSDALIPAITTAMKHAPTTGVTRRIMNLFSDKNPAVREAVATIVAYRDELNENQLSSLLNRSNDLKVAAIFSDKLIELPLDQRDKLWKDMLDSADDSVQCSAVLSMLKAHQPQALDYLTSRVRENRRIAPWMLDCLAVSGGRAASQLVESCMDNKKLILSAIHCLGRLGNPASVDVLLGALEKNREDIRKAAAEALHRITGANVRAENIRSKFPGDDKPFVISQADERSSGADVGLSTTRREWDRWWLDNRDAFQTPCCYRNGVPFEFKHSIEEIADEAASNPNRRFAYLELTIRAGVDTRLEIDWPVEDQLAAIESLKAWWQKSDSHFVKGEWYYGVRPVRRAF